MPGAITVPTETLTPCGLAQLLDCVFQGVPVNELTTEQKQAGDDNEPLTQERMRATVVDLVFGGDPARLDHFCGVVRSALPETTSAVLRGSAVTGLRWKDGAAFDADGSGTSDLDLTLVGPDLLGLFSLTGFFVPGVHSKPLSDDDPDIAPALVPLRAQLMALVKRPVNIQATRDIVMLLRGDLLGQPYLTLVGKADAP